MVEIKFLKILCPDNMLGKALYNLLECSESGSMDRFCTSSDGTLLTNGLTNNQSAKCRSDFDPAYGLQSMVPGYVEHSSAW